jgi:hypothetical protein
MQQRMCAGPGPHIPSSGVLETYADWQTVPTGEARCAAPACDPPLSQNEVTRLANRSALDGNIFDTLRTIAAGSGTFATAAIRDAAIRTCARGIVLIVRILLDKNEAID